MLPKRSRLSKQSIERYLLKGRRIKTSRFLVMYTENKEGKEPQISFSASKKVAPTAVARNNLRRRGYSAVTPLVCHITPKAMILVSYLVADTQVTLPEIREELKKAFIQAGLYKKDE